MNESPTQTLASRSAVLVDLIDRLTGRVQAGEALDADAVAAEYPAFADDLRKLLPVGLLGERSRLRSTSGSRHWATSASCERSGAVVWASCTRPSSSICAAGWR